MNIRKEGGESVSFMEPDIQRAEESETVYFHEEFEK